MNNILNSGFINHPKIILSVFIASLLVLVYWLSVSYFIANVYDIVIVGVLAELLWLPMLVCLILLPIAAILQMAKRNSFSKLLPPCSLIIGIGTIVLLIFN
ncbi:MAG TPA: hypothetical protein VGB71_15960 [Flavisolibacter sp.]|jgi:ABC-type bacteriocin/lantibiotic exporter with double-glycine peptidase domain